MGFQVGSVRDKLHKTDRSAIAGTIAQFDQTGISARSPFKLRTEFAEKRLEILLVVHVAGHPPTMMNRVFFRQSYERLDKTLQFLPSRHGGSHTPVSDQGTREIPHHRQFVSHTEV